VKRRAIGRAVLNYFGSKVSTAHKYPAPKHDLIVEPFAGGAGYSLCHWEHDVMLVDLNPPVVRAWQYVIRATPEEILALPLIEPGQRVDELDCCEDARLLISWSVNMAVSHPCNMLTNGWKGNSKPEHYAAGWATVWGKKRRQRVAEVSAHIKHWRFQLGSYVGCPDLEATWYIDPPYVDAGSNYPCGSSGIDYAHLAQWCRERRGQIMVCENEGAVHHPPLLRPHGPHGAPLPVVDAIQPPAPSRQPGPTWAEEAAVLRRGGAESVDAGRRVG